MIKLIGTITITTVLLTSSSNFLWAEDDEVTNSVAENTPAETVSEKEENEKISMNGEDNAATEELVEAEISEHSVKTPADELNAGEPQTKRAEALRQPAVQRQLRAAKEAFEKLTEKISSIVEKDEEYLAAIRAVDAPVPESKRNQARREAVARAQQNSEVKKLLDVAKKHFESYRKELDKALKQLESKA